MNNWFVKFKKTKYCIFCGNSFKLIDLPYWVYWGSNGIKNCCFQCELETPKKKELIKLLPIFINSCGFIPRADASPINYSFTSRLSSDQWVKAISAYIKIGGIEHVKKKFKSWFKALVDSGVLSDGVLLSGRGIRCFSQDGHMCHSLDEQHIDNWFFSKGIVHEREPYYPTHKTLNPKGRRRADWKVGETFIEYFGLIGDSKYDKKVDEKISLAEKIGIDLITIYPQDIGHIEQKLGRLLN